MINSEAVLALRKAAGFTQQEVVEAAGRMGFPVALRTYQRAESVGTRDIRTAQVIAKVFGVDINKVLYKLEELAR